MSAKTPRAPAPEQLNTLVRNVQLLRRELDSARTLVQTANAHVHTVERALQSNEAILAQLTGEVLTLPEVEDVPVSKGGLAGAVLRGQAAVAKWVADGTLVPSTMFAEAWGVTRQALEQAVERGELFSVKHGNKRFYPTALMSLDRASVAAVCKALGRAEGPEKLIFWLRAHGGLGGKTAVDAVAAGKCARVEQLAEAWAEERGLSDAVAAA